MKSILRDIILENQNNPLPEIIPRQITIPTDLKIIISLIGARRSGKTYIIYQVIKQLRNKGLKKERILFLNFEDERLKLDTENLDEIIQAYTELYPNFELKNCYFFFDEIQNVKGWEKFIRRIFDTKTRNLFITGSNSKLLSSEIATELRGRTLSFTIYPLSLSEYLDFQKVKKELLTQANRSKIIHYTNKFLSEGGFPETVRFEQPYRTKVLQQYFNVMIFRDIVERYKISNIEALKFFIKKIFAGVSKPFSVNKAYNDLKSMGYKVSNKYLYEYLNYCEAVFIGLAVSKFDFSEIKQAKSEKKIYLVDNGLLSSIEFSISKNKGKLLENMVALELLKAGKELFYYKNIYECDFIIKEAETLLPIQVAYELNDDETKQREIRGLVEACKFIKSKYGIIITFDSEDEFEHEGIDIKVISVYRFFLKKKNFL